MKSIYLSDVRADLMVKSSRCRKPHQRDRVWHYWGKLHHRSTCSPAPPLLVLLSFTLSRRVTSLYIIKRRAHAPTSVTILASPACATWLAEAVINHTPPNWPGVRISGQTEEWFWPWTPPLPPAPHSAESGIKFPKLIDEYLWVP